MSTCAHLSVEIIILKTQKEFEALSLHSVSQTQLSIQWRKLSPRCNTCSNKNTLTTDAGYGTSLKATQRRWLALFCSALCISIFSGVILFSQKKCCIGGSAFVILAPSSPPHPSQLWELFPVSNKSLPHFGEEAPQTVSRERKAMSLFMRRCCFEGRTLAVKRHANGPLCVTSSIRVFTNQSEVRRFESDKGV